ncbi:electron transfer flavoprotein alpha-subunit [Xylaria sp. CBS 124048]|nr:electron transfer flavoprotein alpha-subunit [Xylaria sp. CBS 124048]
MASSKVAVRSESAPSLLEPEKTLRASKALIAHLKGEAEKKAATAAKKDLLANDDDDNDNTGLLTETPVFVTFTTKRHPIDSHKLKPTKIPTPIPVETETDKGICLIVADPQRHYKNLVADAEFPADLRKNVSRIIGLDKLKKKFSTYENQRALLAEHDIFLGDSRIINRLPSLLGKTFYKSQKKRPVPIDIEARIPKSGGKRVKPAKGTVNACTAIQLAGEIKRAIGSALVNLAPSTNHAVKIGYASWKPEDLAANVERVVSVMVNKLISGGRKNVRSIYIKGEIDRTGSMISRQANCCAGPETAALPIYMTDELWVDKEKDVIDDASEKAKALLLAEKANIGRKRKSLESGADAAAEPAPKKSKKSKEAKTISKVVPESSDDKLDKEIADRKASLRKQKKVAKKAVDA